MSRSFARVAVFAIASTAGATAFAGGSEQLYYDEGTYRPAQIDQQILQRRGEPMIERERALVPDSRSTMVEQQRSPTMVERQRSLVPERLKSRFLGSSDGFYNDEGTRVPADIR